MTTIQLFNEVPVRALMKYVIIIPDGAADHPLDELGGRTPFEAAKTPHTDRLSIEGRQGTVATTPPELPCGSDVCCMSLLGYDPGKYHRGRAPLEAAAMGITLRKSDWIFRINLVTVIDGKMVDHSAGHISSDEGQQLLVDLAKHVELTGMTFHPGVSYRNIMVDRSGKHDWSALRSTPPHDIPGESVAKYLPVGGSKDKSEHTKLLLQLISQSGRFLADHEINRTRRELGELPATHIWPWGQGQIPDMASFFSRYELHGAMITAVDLLSGIAQLIGWHRLDVPGQTSYHDTDYVAAGQHAMAALETYDLVCVHIEAPDEAAHAGDASTKVAAIEAIDEHVVGPIHAALLARRDEYRILYLPDHYTAVSSRKHEPDPVPFAICGTHITSVLKRPFYEANANASDLHVEYGHELMEYFLFSGIS